MTSTSLRVDDSYPTFSIDLSAYCRAQGFIVVATNEGGKFATFKIENLPELHMTIADYNQGGFAKRLLNARSSLYREASEVMKRGVRNG